VVQFAWIRLRRTPKLRSFASLALQLAILGAIIAAFFVRFWQVSGPSMTPRVSSGEFVLVNTLAYRLGKPQHGDVVAFHHDGVTPELYIKRVIGLPGDTVRIDRGLVLVNGERIDEPYVRFSDQRSVPELTVPAGDVYVLGDNRAVSVDSRTFGPVPESELMGKALVGVWPFGGL
jgi:signal peptidase I